MIRTSRNLLVTVLLALVVCYASLSVHVATHTGGDTGSCQLCTSWSHATPPLGQETNHAVQLPRHVPSSAPQVTVPRFLHTFGFRQRGPPSLN